MKRLVYLTDGKTYSYIIFSELILAKKPTSKKFVFLPAKKYPEVVVVSAFNDAYTHK